MLEQVMIRVLLCACSFQLIALYHCKEHNSSWSLHIHDHLYRKHVQTYDKMVIQWNKWHSD